MSKKLDLTGLRYGRLTALSKAELYISPKGAKQSKWNCICDCGNKSTVMQVCLRSGDTKSCGCLNVDSSTTHGDKNHQIYRHLYNQYDSMKARVKSRVNCESEFVDYIDFKEWAISQGWVKGMNICRNGDIGNYRRSNARVDTAQSNGEERSAKNWIFVSPIGAITHIYNLAKFCRNNNLNKSAMGHVHRGRSVSYNGWTKPDPSRLHEDSLLDKVSYSSLHAEELNRELAYQSTTKPGCKE